MVVVVARELKAKSFSSFRTNIYIRRIVCSMAVVREKCRPRISDVPKPGGTTVQRYVGCSRRYVQHGKRVGLVGGKNAVGFE